MNKFSKKAILSVLSLVVTFVALGATTFAWFSLGTTASVNPFEMDVKGSEGLEISLDGEKWYSTINSDVMYDHIKGLLNDNDGTSTGKIVMDALTSEDGENFYKMGIGTSTTEGDVTTTYLVHGVEQEAAPNTDYLSLTFHFRTKTSYDVNLDDLNVTTTNVKEWVSDLDFTLVSTNTDVKVDDELNGSSKNPDVLLEDALRVSFVNGDNATVFEKAEDDTNTTGTESYQGAWNYFSQKMGYGTDNNVLEKADGWTTVSTNGNFGTGLDTVSLTNDNQVTDGYNTMKVTVNIWFEGYDNEAFNVLLDQTVSIGFKFSLKED